MSDDGLTVWLMVDFGGTVEPLPEAPSWFRDAACFGSGIDYVEPGSKDAVRAALDLCGRCRVREPCYALAVAEGHVYGIFGGTTEKQRSRLRNGHEAA